jgi:hypothetical protein
MKTSGHPRRSVAECRREGHWIPRVREMLADASSFVCSAAKAGSLVPGATKRRLLGLLGVGIGIGIEIEIEIELGWLDNRSATATDTDDQALSV